MQRCSQDKRYKEECYSAPLHRVWFVCMPALLVILGCQSRELFGGRMLWLANDFSYNEPTGPTVANPVKLGRRDGEDAPRTCLGISFISQTWPKGAVKLSVKENSNLGNLPYVEHLFVIV